MAERISRRTFGALALGAVGAASGVGPAKANQEGPGAEIAGDLAAIGKKLAKPLSDRARELTLTQLKNNKDYLKERYKFELPENSEPCFVFPPTPVSERRGR